VTRGDTDPRRRVAYADLPHWSPLGCDTKHHCKQISGGTHFLLKDHDVDLTERGNYTLSAGTPAEDRQCREDIGQLRCLQCMVAVPARYRTAQARMSSVGSRLRHRHRDHISSMQRRRCRLMCSPWRKGCSMEVHVICTTHANRRFYTIMLAQSLFGRAVIRTWGRIGTVGGRRLTGMRP
jgi:hypothetical protein